MLAPLSFPRSDRLACWLVPVLAIGSCLMVWFARECQAAEPAPAQTILEELRGFREMGSVLYVAAHPDDENTQLIAYLARGRNYRTAYLSLTRGDGGQNVIGPELFEELGVIRTQELLAARRVDGGRQFFTRAIDFGYSKNATETLRIWDRQQVVSDIVRVIRTFRPDVVIARFSPQGGGHGHHTASAILAVEAFKQAGDARAFPEQIGELTAWQPKRILQNGGGFGRGGGGGGSPGAVRIEIGGDDPVSGEPLGAIAGQSRSMHKTQGFGNFGGGGGGPRSDSFTLLAGAPASTDILDGVDTTWGRVTGGAEVGTMADAVIAKFDSKEPAASVPALLAIRRRLSSLPADRVVDEKRGQLDRIIQGCLGLVVQTTVPRAEVVPGEVMVLRHTATVGASVPVRWLAVRYPLAGKEAGEAIDLHPGQPAVREASEALPATSPLSQPYWLREDHPIGMYRVDAVALIGRPENPPAFPVEHRFQVGGETLVIPDEPVQITAGTEKGETRHRLDVIPPVSLRYPSEVRLFAPGSERPVEVEVTAARAGAAGTLELDAPEGWTVTPTSRPFRLTAVDDRVRLSFHVKAPGKPASAEITARAHVAGATSGNQRVVIQHAHIPRQLLQPLARVKTVALELAIRGQRVGYLPGAGDRVAESLGEMGYQVKQLSGDDLTADGLRGLDAVVIGIRAYNVRNDLAAHLPALFAYVESGGAVVAQYNRPNGLRTGKLAPYDLRLSDARVTDENAPVTFLAPDHPALNTPNRITPADFEGWVQERGIYFPGTWDAHFTPLIASGDPGETPLKGGVLVAKYGRGYFVYTGLVWFRQLPEGVPGAYRFFANLVSLGK